MKKTTLIATLFFLILSFDSIALSEYGATCEDNSDCVECKNIVACQTCMNNCWNFYGPAEVETDVKSRDDKELCRIRWAKWCNAQCWDPDDKKDPEYVPTKPICNEESPFPKYFDGKRPW